MARLSEGFYSLSEDTNKVGELDTTSVSVLLPELTLDLSDEELIDLQRDWLKAWEQYAIEIEKKQKENEDYWMGKQFSDLGKDKPVDNLVFEALETFLPIATRPRAEPIVEANNTTEGNALADKVRKMLIHLADELSFNLKMKQVARFWGLYMLGVMKVGWSMKENNITCVAVRPQKLILDPDACVEDGEYKGYYVGEKLQDMASDLVLRFPKSRSYIEEKVKGKMGTTVEYIMWTTDDYVFWTLDKEVLAKNKNPNWNYETEQPGPMDVFGNPGPMQTIPGKNHFNRPKKPYVFLSIFNLGKHPHDDTNLIQQALPMQDLINKRLQQIDKNADNTNGGLIVSGDAFTEKQAGDAAKALRKGGVVYVPTGSPDASVKRDTGTPLPAFVYESLLDYRNELRNIFGTRGSTPQGTVNEQTVRGKLLIRGQDADRVGGGVSTFLEQFADNVFNWWVQLMYVYYDEPHSAAVLGREKAQEYITLKNSEFGNLKLRVGVKEGSMIPHDPVSERNEAVDLWAQGALDPITFFERLDFPEPREKAKQLYLWKADPLQLFPDLLAQQQQQMAMQQQAQAQQMAQQQQAAVQSAQQKQAGDREKMEMTQRNRMNQIVLQAAVKGKK